MGEKIRFRIEVQGNGTFLASIIESSTKGKNSSMDPYENDQVGALYYVLAVIFIYGFSIVMMIASHIRKNKIDRKLNHYLKEMATVRKREQQMQLYSAAAKIVSTETCQAEGAAKIVPPCTEITEEQPAWTNKQRRDSRDSTDSRQKLTEKLELKPDDQQEGCALLPLNGNTNSVYQDRVFDLFAARATEWSESNAINAQPSDLSASRLQSTSNDSVFEDTEVLLTCVSTFDKERKPDGISSNIQVITSL